MPSGHPTEKVPDRSSAETMGRDLSLDEKKDDIARLRDVEQATRKLAGRLEGLNDPELRHTFQALLIATADSLDSAGEGCVTEVRRAIFAFTGDKETRNPTHPRSKRYR